MWLDLKSVPVAKMLTSHAPYFLYRLKCHNKCTKEAPSCRISFLPSKLCWKLSCRNVDGQIRFCIYIVTFPFSLIVAKIRRTESVPSDINNPVDRPPEAPQFGTLPKAITKKVRKKICFGNAILRKVSGSSLQYVQPLVRLVG